MDERTTILDDIGNTPLLKLNHVTDALGVDIYVKCEFTNPGGSIKDRMALSMIEEAEKRGDLGPGGTIVDQSTGNTGPALSFVGAVKGYDVRLFLPTQLSSEYNPTDRIRISRLYGCEVTPIDLNDHMENADQLQGLERSAAFVAVRNEAVLRPGKKRSIVLVGQPIVQRRQHKGSPRAHGAGDPGSDGGTDRWLGGTGGTLLGVAQTLLEHHPGLKVSGVVPTDDPRIEWVRSRAVHDALERFGVPDQRFLIQDLLDSEVMDTEVTIENDDARKMADRLCREEGLYCGMSSGANVVAAIEMAKTMEKGSRIVTVVVDRRDRYSAEYPNEHYVV